MTNRKSPEPEYSSENEEMDVHGNGSSFKKAKVENAFPSKNKVTSAKKKKRNTQDRFIGSPLSKAEASKRWPHRYSKPSKVDDAAATPGSEKKRKASADDDESNVGRCKAHYLKAEVDGVCYELGDCVYVNSGEGPDYIGRIVEFFCTVDGSLYFTSQWFFRASDTAIGESESKKHDPKRLFVSEVKDDNPLDCLVSKLKIIRLPPTQFFNQKNPKPIPPCDYYYDMGYDYAFSTFYKLPEGVEAMSTESDSTVCDEKESSVQSECSNEVSSAAKQTASSTPSKKKKVAEEITLLDLYSGCGGMSTGLCQGAFLAGANLVTRWALDLNEYACKSLKYNHPETQVRNESADDFLVLLKEWKKLCEKFTQKEEASECSDVESDNEESEEVGDGEFEVEKIIGIRYRSPSDSKNSGLEFKVHWKGYTSSEDSWEPLEGLEGCDESIKKFVLEGHKKQLLPLPGELRKGACDSLKGALSTLKEQLTLDDMVFPFLFLFLFQGGQVDVICGGPPCQGASGFNRFRNKEDPLSDARNRQVIVYMDIVDFLKPRFVLMENVVDILKFAGGIIGRYAISRLAQMHYQAKLGLIVAGSFGLPQFRMRVFLWGASPSETLPPYPLPTHDVVGRGACPLEWERNMVAYEETNKPQLMKALTLGDALSDLPPVENSETRDEMSYGRPSRTEFQKFIRLPKLVFTGEVTIAECKKQKLTLNDHRPFQLNTDDYQRTCRIPKEKGANFRRLPGVIVLEDNTVALDPKAKRVLLPSGKPLVPDYAITFVKGKSLKPFGRLWWDETVATVVTRPEPHNQALLHPEQDRVLTIRENARLQGFPDFYKLFGPVRERYIQVGNAVAVPVGRALGYTLGKSIKQKVVMAKPLTELPPKFPQCLIPGLIQITESPVAVDSN